MIKEGTKVIYSPNYGATAFPDKVVGHVYQQTTDGFYRVKWLAPLPTTGYSDDFFTLHTDFKEEDLFDVSKLEVVVSAKAHVEAAYLVLLKAEGNFSSVNRGSLSFRLYTLTETVSRLLRDLEDFTQEAVEKL